MRRWGWPVAGVAATEISALKTIAAKVASAAVIVANILVDIVYAVLDPRVRLH